jgi:hypothetical protein
MLPGSQSMRANYAGGIDKYYTEQASSTYRNPHYPGILKTLSTFLDNYTRENASTACEKSVQVLDLAAGSGEATDALMTWSKRRAFKKLPTLQFDIFATDPYTAPAYKDRIQKECLPLSFSDIADGGLPDKPELYDLAICSFALHLLTETSQLWALLSHLATRAKYLVVLAPHKKPNIKAEWGWNRVDPWTMAEVDDSSVPQQMGGKRGDGYEIYEERVRLRVWRSYMVEDEDNKQLPESQPPAI